MIGLAGIFLEGGCAVQAEFQTIGASFVVQRLDVPLLAVQWLDGCGVWHADARRAFLFSEAEAVLMARRASEPGRPALVVRSTGRADSFSTLTKQPS